MLSTKIYATAPGKLRTNLHALLANRKFPATIRVTLKPIRVRMESNMAGNRTIEAHKLILFVEKTPFPADEKTRLKELLETNGMTDETTEEVRKVLTGLPKESFGNDWQRAKFVMDLKVILRQWQMTQGSKKFKHSR